MNLPQFSLKRPVTVVVAMLVFVTIGIISLVRLPLEMMPDISFPGLMVWVPYPSSSPEEVEAVCTPSRRQSPNSFFPYTINP